MVLKVSFQGNLTPKCFFLVVTAKACKNHEIVKCYIFQTLMESHDIYILSNLFLNAVDLLGLLRWQEVMNDQTLLKKHLEHLMKVDGEEIVKVNSGPHLWNMSTLGLLCLVRLCQVLLRLWIFTMQGDSLLSVIIGYFLHLRKKEA